MELGWRSVGVFKSYIMAEITEISHSEWNNSGHKKWGLVQSSCVTDWCSDSFVQTTGFLENAKMCKQVKGRGENLSIIRKRKKTIPSANSIKFIPCWTEYSQMILNLPLLEIKAFCNKWEMCQKWSKMWRVEEVIESKDTMFNELPYIDIDSFSAKKSLLTHVHTYTESPMTTSWTNHC